MGIIRRKKAGRRRQRAAAARQRRREAAARRKAAAAERRKTASPRPRQAHDYRTCRDQDCERHVCAVFREGMQACPLPHQV